MNQWFVDPPLKGGQAPNLAAGGLGTVAAGASRPSGDRPSGPVHARAGLAVRVRNIRNAAIMTFMAFHAMPFAKAAA